MHRFSGIWLWERLTPDPVGGPLEIRWARGFRGARSICAASQTLQKHGHNHMSKPPEIDLSDLRDLLRAYENYLTFASKGHQLHENDTSRLLARTTAVIATIDAIRAQNARG